MIRKMITKLNSKRDFLPNFSTSFVEMIRAIMFITPMIVFKITGT